MLPSITWHPNCWRDTEATAIAETLPPEMVTALLVDDRKLPHTRTGARRRHAARREAIKIWLGQVWDVLPADEQTRFARAACAWALSEPGDIPRQWQHLPDSVFTHLHTVCEALGSRGGASCYAPIASVLRDELSYIDNDEHLLDYAIREDDWQAVRNILAGRDLTGWLYVRGLPLPPRAAVTFETPPEAAAVA